MGKRSLTALLPVESAEISPAYSSALRRFRAAVAHRNDSPIDVLVVGDSMSELGDGSILNRWINNFARRAGKALGGGYGVYYPTVPGLVVSRQAGDPWTTSGGAGAYVGALGLRAWVGTSGAHSVTCTFTGNRITVLYTITATAATAIEFVLDGTVVQTVNMRTGTVQWGAQWDSGALTEGSHTLLLRNAGGTHTGNWIVEGAMVESGSRNGMVRVWDGSQSGYSAANFADPTYLSLWSDPVDIIDPDLLIVMLGGNDETALQTPAQVVTNIGTIVSTVKTQGDPDPSVLVAIEWGKGTDSAGTWEPYESALQIACRANDWSAINIHAAAGNLQSDTVLTVDLVHGNAAGHNLITDLLMERLGIVQFSEATSTGTLSIPAASFYPRETAGAGNPARVELPTNDINVFVSDFPNAGAIASQCFVAMPPDWNGGTVTARVWWNTSATTGSVVWQVSGRSYADGETLDQALGTAQVIADAASATANQALLSAATPAITLAGTPAASELVCFQLLRDPAHASDTLAAGAFPIAVVITYGRV